MKRRRLLGLVLGLMFIGTLLAPYRGLAKEPIKIGYMNSMTGGSALTGLPMVQAFKLAVREINEAGGILGHPVKYVVRDDKSNPSVASREARDLVYSERVDWIFGTCQSNVALSISQVAKETKTPFVIEGSMGSSLTEELGHRYAIRPLGNSHTQAGAVAYSLSKKPYKTYTLMASDYAWGHDSLKDFKAILLRENPQVTILKEDYLPPSLPEYSPYITSLSDIKPDVAVILLPTGEAATFLKQLGPHGLHKKCLVAGLYLDQTGFEALGKDMPEGVMVFSQFLFNYPGKEADAFRAKIRRETGLNAGGGIFLGYWPSFFLKAAITKAGTKEKEAVINAFGTISLKLPQGIVRMRTVDNQGDFANMVGITKFIPQYEFAVTVDNEYYPGDKLLPAPDEILKKRAEKK